MQKIHYICTESYFPFLLSSNGVYNRRWLPLKFDVPASMSKHRMWSGASFVLVKFSARVPQNYKILNRFIAYQFYTRGRISASHSEEMHYKKSNCDTKKSSFSQAKINDKFPLWLIFIRLHLTAKVFTGRYPHILKGE